MPSFPFFLISYKRGNNKMIGDQLRNQMILYGHPSCINTSKCLQTAAEKGVDVEARVVQAGDTSSVSQVSPLGILPALEDVDYKLYGTLAIMSYLDDKGFGPSLVPRNGVIRSIMYKWITVAMSVQDSIASGDVEKAKPALAELGKQTASPPARGDFICGDFSLADIHWTACCNMLFIKGHGDAVSSVPSLAKWFDAVKAHPSTSKENIIPFTAVATADDVEKGVLRNIAINVAI